VQTFDRCLRKINVGLDQLKYDEKMIE